MAEQEVLTANPETPATIPATRNVFARLLDVRMDFLKIGAKKTGKNLHAEFMYFDLEDIVPIAEPLFFKHGLLLICTFIDGNAIAHVVNTEDTADYVDFTIPLVYIAEPGKFRMNETQAAGAVVTYYRRYLYMLVLDLVESDAIDSQNGDKNLPKEETTAAVTPPPPKKHVSAEERKAIKSELVSEDGAATEGQIEQLKSLLKKLIDVDPNQEEFVQTVALKTNRFKEITQNQCTSLIAGVKQMFSEYDDPDEV